MTALKIDNLTTWTSVSWFVVKLKEKNISIERVLIVVVSDINVLYSNVSQCGAK